MRLLFILCVGMFSYGCATNLGTGILAGGTLGAGAGGITSGGGGALIGSAAGLVMGSLLGAGLDWQDRKVMQKSSPRTVDRMDHGDPLTLSDVIKLSQNGVTDDVIIDYMQEKKTIYQLTQTQVRRLQETGVSQRVINYMLHTRGVS